MLFVHLITFVFFSSKHFLIPVVGFQPCSSLRWLIMTYALSFSSSELIPRCERRKRLLRDFQVNRFSARKVAFEWNPCLFQRVRSRTMSSPSSSFSSPCRRSPRVLSASGSPGTSGACSTGLRPNLNRRWSLDNISSQREGYVRDLRRQHNRDRVEVGSLRGRVQVRNLV